MNPPGSIRDLRVNSGWTDTDSRRPGSSWLPVSYRASSQPPGVNRFLTVFLRRRRSWLAGIGGLLPAELGGVGGQELDVVVGEVGGLDPAGDAGFGEQPG